jgi:hypothetical protein
MIDRHRVAEPGKIGDDTRERQNPHGCHVTSGFAGN